jgi:hypothetical protein
LKLGPSADLAIVAGGPSPAIQGPPGRARPGKKWHFGHSNGTERQTLQEELPAFKPFGGVKYLANDNGGI